MRRHCVAAWWMVAMAATISGVHAVTTTPSAETCPVELGEGTSRLEPVIEKHEAALFLLLGFGGFSVLVALCYKALRKYVFGDSHSLDTVFDAGGRVSVSLTAVTVTSQLLWPADFLQSSTLISKVMYPKQPSIIASSADPDETAPSELHGNSTNVTRT